MSGLAIRLGQPNVDQVDINQLLETGSRASQSDSLIVSGGANQSDLTKPNMMYSSNNGITWYPSTNTFFFNGIYRDSAYSPELQRWVAVGQGENGSICYSNDGKTWFASTNIFGNTTPGGFVVEYANGVFLAGGFDVIAKSVDGIQWNVISSFFAGGVCQGFAYSPNLNRWVATGKGNLGSMAYSDDNGVTFLAGQDFWTSNGAGTGVAYGNGRWIVAGTDDQTFEANTKSIGWSDDGINWTAANNVYSNGTGTLAVYGQNKWIACGLTLAGNSRPCYSLDNGVSWSLIPDADTLFVGFGVNYIPSANYFLAFGQSARGRCVILSEDGIAWTVGKIYSSSGIAARFVPLYLSKFIDLTQ